MSKTLIISLLTFLLGIGTGAAVFSQPFSQPSTPPPMGPASAGPDDEDAGQAASAPLAVGVVAPVDAPAVATDSEPEPEPEPVLPAQAREQLATLMDGWGRMQAELADLRARVVSLEQRPAAVTGAAEPERPASDSPTAQRDALVRAGLAPVAAEEIIGRRAQVALDQLELRDLAIREGWLGSERYREALREINARQVSLRDELDPFAYDRFLYESGEVNRVRVDSVIPGSVGDQSGLLSGDLIESYDDQRIFDYRELRTATSDGTRGELVPVQVRRNDEVLEVWLPRGPIGIQLDSARVEP